MKLHLPIKFLHNNAAKCIDNPWVDNPNYNSFSKDFFYTGTFDQLQRQSIIELCDGRVCLDSSGEGDYIQLVAQPDLAIDL